MGYMEKYIHNLIWGMYHGKLRLQIELPKEFDVSLIVHHSIDLLQ
jgi:hypothetical protein